MFSNPYLVQQLARQRIERTERRSPGGTPRSGSSRNKPSMGPKPWRRARP